jgi:hypothetical protein
MAFAKRLYTQWKDLLGAFWIIEIHDESGAVASSYLGGKKPLAFRLGPAGDLETPIKDVECAITVVETADDDYSWLNTDDDRKIKIIVKQRPPGTASTTSSTSMAIAMMVTKALVVETNLTIIVGSSVSLVADTFNSMTGTVLSYDSETGDLSVDVTAAEGSGTYDSWVVTLVTPIGTKYVGWILSSQYSTSFGANNILDVTFSDQLRLIANKPFLEDNGIYPPTGLDTLLNQVQRALASTGLLLYLNIASNLFRSDMLTSSYEDPFAQASLDQDIWMDDNYEPGKCGNVLEEILKGMQCRICQCNGEWWIIRLKECLQGTRNPVYRKFNPVGAVVSYGNLEPEIHTILETGVRNFIIYGGNLTFNPEWKERDLEIDYGLRQTLIASLNVDTYWIDDHTHRYWTNMGDAWNHLNSGEYAFIKAYTNQRTSMDPSLQLYSPSFAVAKDAMYTLTVNCGKNRGNWPVNPCPVVIELTIGATIYNYDDKNSEWVNVGTGSYIPLDGITFQKIDTDVIGKKLLQESVTTTAIPDNGGTIIIRFYAPYKATALNDNTYYYLGDVEFKRTTESDTLPNGEVTNIAINAHAATTPEALQLVINGGDVVRDSGTIETDRYLGILVKVGAVQNPDFWSEVGPYAPATSQSLKQWILDSWYDQHNSVSRAYTGSFRGLAEFYTVFCISEFGNRYFVWDDVEYDVYRGVWEGTVIEIKDLAASYPTSTLKFGSLPVAGVLPTASNSGTTAKPGGDTNQVQANINGQLTGIDIFWEDGELKDVNHDPLIIPQVQADWDQVDSSQIDYIWHKPNIPTYVLESIEESGSIYIQLTDVFTPSISTLVELLGDGITISIDSSGALVFHSDATAQIQADWNQTNISALDYIKNKPPRVYVIKVISDTTVLTTGDGKMKFPIPLELNGMKLVKAEAAITTVSSSGITTIAVYNYTDSVDMLSTLITIDVGEFTSYTALVPPVIDPTHDTVATGDILGIDVDISGTGVKGLTIILTFE